jgi:exodeoxyribonuclease V alpha subunit
MKKPASPKRTVADEQVVAVDLAASLLSALDLPADHPGLGLVTAAYAAVLNGQSCHELDAMPAKSVLVGGPADVDTPLVAQSDGKGGALVYLRRMDELEEQLARRLQALAEPRPEAKRWDASGGAQIAAADKLNAAQRDGILRLGTHSLVILTGGPGTGKTYTLNSLLRHAVVNGKLRPSDIRLVAPTGRAARRIADGLASLRATEEFKNLSEPQTIHSLLYEHEAFDTLQLLVIDESSMVDLMLFSETVEKLPKDCSLVLVGDPDQLPSVDVGSVLSDLCAAPALSSVKVTLTEQNRSKDSPEIMEMARAVLTRTGLESIRTTEPKLEDILALVRIEYGRLVEHAREGRVEEAVGAIDAVRVLCSHARGPLGAQALSRAIADELKVRLDPPSAGALLMVTRNDRRGTGLSNGDVGVVVNGLVYFRGQVVGFDLSRLPEYAPAFATTIHKAQGSEYGHAVVVVGESEREDFLNRQLIYTAITRAKSKVTIFAKAETFQTAAKRDVTRASGLGQRLA